MKDWLQKKRTYWLKCWRGVEESQEFSLSSNISVLVNKRFRFFLEDRYEISLTYNTTEHTYTYITEFDKNTYIEAKMWLARKILYNHKELRWQFPIQMYGFCSDLCLINSDIYIRIHNTLKI